MRAADAGGRLDRLDLSAEAREVFLHLSDGGPLPDPGSGPARARQERALSELLAGGLIADSPFSQGRYVVQDLAQVERSVVQAEIGELLGRLQRLSRVPEVLAGLAAEAGAQPVGGIERLADKGEANDVLTRMVAGVEACLWSAHPVDRPAWSLEASLERDLAIVRRGLEYRTIYPNTARARDAEVKWVAAMTDAGAAVRTRAPDYLRMIVVDRKAVMIAAPPEFDGRTEAFFITQPVVVAIVVSFYEQLWERSRPWRGERRQEAGELATTPQMRDFIRMLRENRTRSEIARTLGTSERSLTSLLGRIYRATGTNNLVALGEWWATSPDRDQDLG
ncbi:hypothetical protein ACIQWR_26035 [Streptomyces sp. NPDC098789]|uniref:hypothetical protein n=1 Tax=Streptomyces sp. NPDC098789 TaxID=3366098 RepID=UPI0038067138